MKQLRQVLITLTYENKFYVEYIEDGKQVHDILYSSRDSSEAWYNILGWLNKLWSVNKTIISKGENSSK